MANIFDSESPYVINGQLWIGKTGTQIPNAGLQLGPGIAASNNAPLKFTAGINLTTPEAGAMEFDGTHLYITIGSTRYTLDQQSSAPAVPVDITGVSANALTVGANGTTNPQFNVDTSTASVATGINIKGAAAAGGVALSTLSSGTNENLIIDAKGTGTIGINTIGTTSGLFTIGNSTSLAGLQVNGLTNITSASANALTVGPNGATTPILNVNAATTSAVTGLKITGAATGVAVAVIATDSGSNTPITIDGKGTGTIGINTLSITSGLVTLGNSTSNAGLVINGAIIQNHGTAAINSSATATAAQVATGYITSTSAAGTTITLPTGTLLGTALNAKQGTIHYLTIDNTAGASTVTIAVAVNGILSAAAAAGSGAGAGLLTIPSGVTGQGTFMLMFSSATAYTFSRIA
jgi:hypothetical protein